MIGEVERVSPDPGEASRAPGVEPRQPEEIDALASGHPAPVRRLSGAVERRRVEPAKVRAKADAPEDCGGTRALEGERAALYGALGPKASGAARISGAPYRPRYPGAAKAAGVGFVAADRKKEGIIGDLTVRENMVAPFQDRYVKGLFVSKAAETQQARHWIKALSIRARGPEQKMRTLSGGNQQRVCVA